jgi:hypothetical protein
MAFDETLSGLITLCPPAPFRTDIDAAETGGIARWAGRDMLMPRMGLFIGDERRVPYDVHQLMACVAPRPQLVISPTLDREAPVAEVTRAVESARAIYELFGASEAFTQVTPEDWNRFSEKSEEVILNWLRTQSA